MLNFKKWTNAIFLLLRPEIRLKLVMCCLCWRISLNSYRTLSSSCNFSFSFFLSTFFPRPTLVFLQLRITSEFPLHFTSFLQLAPLQTKLRVYRRKWRCGARKRKRRGGGGGGGGSSQCTVLLLLLLCLSMGFSTVSRRTITLRFSKVQTEVLKSIYCWVSYLIRIGSCGEFRDNECATVDAVEGKEMMTMMMRTTVTTTTVMIMIMLKETNTETGYKFMDVDVDWTGKY